MKNLPNELLDEINQLANNKCRSCGIKCLIPYKKINIYYYCSKRCFHTEYSIHNINNFLYNVIRFRLF